jgi:hypothetical protein
MNPLIPLPDPVPATSQNIAKVKINLSNMQRFNDLLYTYSIIKCANAFLLLSKNDDNDPGMLIGVNLLCGALIGVGGEFGIIGCVAANYFCGLISEYAVSTPPSLLMKFVSYTTRIQATSVQADYNLSIEYSDPVSNWNTIKSGSFDTPWGKTTLGCSLSQLAAISFPAETDSEFEVMMDKAIFSFEQSLWWYILNQNFQVNGWNSGFMLPIIVQASDVPKGDEGMNNYSNSYMLENPAHWSTWSYDHSTDKKGRDTSVYFLYDFSLGVEPTNKGKDQPISNDAANYLFIDTIPNTIINQNGLFNRYFVFNQFGLKTIEQPS